jgi:hypothetical protein
MAEMQVYNSIAENAGVHQYHCHKGHIATAEIQASITASKGTVSYDKIRVQRDDIKRGRSSYVVAANQCSWVGGGGGCNWVRGKFLQMEPVPCHNPAPAIVGNRGEASEQEISTSEVN